ncbi:MAG: polysaccharide deacetylase family protein, partial [bacterium]
MNKKLILTKLKGILFSILSKTRGYLLFYPFFSGIGSILMLHRVIVPAKTGLARLMLNKSMEISPSYLESIIHYCITHDYEIISLNDLYRLFSEKKKQKKKFVCFTFDDGYIDIYTTVYPMFRRYNIPFAVHISTDFPDKKILFWWYALEDIIIKASVLTCDYRGKEITYILKNAKEREKAFYDLRTKIFKMERIELVSFLEKICSDNSISL